MTTIIKKLCFYRYLSDINMKLFIDLLELFVWIYILYFTIRKVLFTFIGGKVRYTRYLSQSAENLVINRETNADRR